MIGPDARSVEATLRRHGLEGEVAFQALCNAYLQRCPSAAPNVPEAFAAKWKRAWARIKGTTADEILANVARADAEGSRLGDWYQFFVGRRFRQGSGKFFTPRPVAAAMAELLSDRRNPVIMDPTCGGGTFLVEAARRWMNRRCTLVANDIEGSLVELTSLSLGLVCSGGHEVHLLNANIFEPSSELAGWYGEVDFILANPPFSLRIKDEVFDSPLFQLGYRNSDALFLDLAHRLLRPGGRLACLLPHSIVSNNEYAALREAMESEWRLAAVFCLPEGVFHLSAGTTARTDVVVLDKTPTKLSQNRTVLASVPSAGTRLNSQAKRSDNDFLQLLHEADVREALAI